MVSSIEPSVVSVGPVTKEISATICPGMTKSASSSLSVRRCATASAFGPAIRNDTSWRSPTKVSDCQSTERKAVSKILSRGTPARATSARRSPEAAIEVANFALNGLQISAHPRHRIGARIASLPQVENEAWIAHGFTSKAGWGNVAPSQKFLHLS